MKHLTRQLDLIPVEALTKKIHVIGAGAIGSHAVLMLAKMGMTSIAVYDFDEVSIENMNSQGYRFKDIGYKKVDALAAIVEDYTGTKILPYPMKVSDAAFPAFSGIVVLAADSMETRKTVFDRIAKLCPMVTHVIDTRMGAEEALMYVMQPQDAADVESYHKTLYTDEEAAPARCTAKATIYTANMLAGHAVKAVKNIICKEEYPRVTLWSIKNNDFQSWGKQ